MQGAGGKFESIQEHFKRLQEVGPKFGYYPEPDKCILIVPEDSLEKAKAEFADLQFKIKTRHRYLGGFIGEKEARDEWIQELTENWSLAVKEIGFVARAYPHTHSIMRILNL